MKIRFCARPIKSEHNTAICQLGKLRVDVGNMTSVGQDHNAARPGLVITAVGPDRPGLIFDLSTQITSHGANIEDTRMSKLGGMFAVLMLVTGTESALSELLSERLQLERSLGINCFLAPTHASASPVSELWRFSTTGIDRPGIVAIVSELLAKNGVNVTSFLSRIENAPLSGTPLFVLEAECVVAEGTSKPIIESTLKAACEREGLELISS